MSEEQSECRIDALPLDSPEVEAMRKDSALRGLYISGPYFTWDIQGPQPPRKERRDDDPPYPVVRVYNSHSPGLFKQGRLVRPITPINAELAIWEVEIEGRILTVHDPEEAWQ